MKKTLILRTVPLTRFYLILDKIIKFADRQNSVLLLQENIISDFINTHDFKIQIMDSGKLGFFKGLKILKFKKIRSLIIPINSYEIENYLNLLFFAIGIRSNEYILYFSNNCVMKFNRIQYYKYVIKVLLSKLLMQILIILSPLLSLILKLKKR